MKKRGKNKVLILVLIIAIIIVLLFGLYFLLKPTFTGKVVETQETSAFSLEGSVLQNQVENPSIQKSRIDLSINRQIYGFSINGDVHLNSDNSLVRVILVDNKDKEYLVYEEYPLISDNKAEIKNHCEETCALNGVVPSYLKIQNINASVKINSFNYIDSSENLETGNWIKKTLKLFIREDKSKRIINIDKEKKANQESKKIEKIKAGIKEKNQKWTAGETSVSNMSYEDKKNLFLKSDGTPVDELPNLQGLEYYTGGVFEFSNENVQESTSQSNVKTPIITGSAITGAVIESGYGILSITSNIAGASLYLDGSNTFWTTRANGSINYSAQAGNHVVKIIKPGYYPYYANVSVKEGQTITISAILIAGEAGLVINSAPPGFYVVTTDEEFIDDNIIYTGTPSYAIGSTPITMSMTPGNHSFIIQKVVGEPYSYNVTINSVKGQTTIINVPYSSKYPLSWDWRNRNGENWMTSVKNQGILPACDLYATIGELEAGTNLYFNQHLDLDLSEMDLTSCINRSRLSAVNEFCFSTHDNTLTCGCVLNPQTCPKPDCTTVMAGNMEAINSGLVKDYLIRNGPVYATYLGFGQSHAMVLVGWVTASDSDTIWIFKNSWGGSWGESGYYRVKGEGFGNGKIIYYPITITSNPNLQISCVDKDNDGYCNWGISENKPSTCPASCNLERDCDDSNPNIGPFVSYNGAVKNYSCVGQSIVPSTGNLSVTSNPTGATVYLDGLNKGISPITIASLATGSHSLVLSKTGYNNYTTSVSINANQLTTISATLTPITTPVTTGNLSVSSSPTGASVYLDNINQGITPIVINNVSEGNHSLKLTMNDYNDYNTNVNIIVGQLTSINAILTPIPVQTTGDLSITSSPSGASVYLDDVYKGISPLTLTEISEGNHSLKLTMNDYNDYNTNVNIIVGQLTTVSAILNPVTPPQSGQSFSDNFDRADSLDLGSSWNIISGGFAVSNNNAVNALTKSIHIAIAPSFNSAKQIVSADFTSVDNNLGPKFGLILRYQDPSNYYLMYRQTGGSSMIIISKIVNGIETKLKTGSLGNPAKNVFFKIKGEADDGTLKLSIDNGSPITITDNTFSSGSAGIWVNTLGGAYSHKVDNFIASDSSTQTMPSSKFSLKNIIDWLRNLF